MLRWWKIAIVVLGALLLASIPLAMQFEPGTIEGYVTDQNGPVSSATVEAQALNSGSVFHAESDASGWYSVEGLRAGRYSLHVRAMAHDTVWVPRVVVNPGKPTHEDVFLDRHTGPSVGD